MEVREAVLIAQRHPDTVKALLTELNRQKDKKGRPYHFALTTWDEEGIARMRQWLQENYEAFCRREGIPEAAE